MRNKNLATVYCQELANVLVNIAISILNNFQLIIWNYFAAFITLILQFIGYHYSKVKRVI